MSGPIFHEIALRLANAGPQWRPEADAITAELVTYMRGLERRVAATPTMAVTARPARWRQLVAGQPRHEQGHQLSEQPASATHQAHVANAATHH
jgi:hypothetical protein